MKPALCYYSVSQKQATFIFVNSFVRYQPILIILACNIVKKKFDINGHSFANLSIMAQDI